MAETGQLKVLSRRRAVVLQKKTKAAKKVPVLEGAAEGETVSLFCLPVYFVRILLTIRLAPPYMLFD